jgi:acyl-CoA synthetase (AMP-forming)/AMP-acid ligase II
VTGPTANIATALTEVAGRLPAKLAVIEGERQVTFGELDSLCDRYAHGLSLAGITRQTRTVLMVRPGIEFFALTFALFKVGAVLVMIDPGIGRASIGTCVAEADPEAFVGVGLAHVGRVLFGWGRRTIRTLVTVGRRWFWGGLTHTFIEASGEGRGRFAAAATTPGETAAILFTSGSTGAPKGAVYTHRMFLTQVTMLREHFGMGPEEIDLPTFPLFALFDAALGLTAIVPRMDFTRPGAVEPMEIIRPILRHKVTQMFGSPALLDRVGRFGAKESYTLKSLKRVISAGAPVSPAVLERFCAMLAPEAQIHTPYGATEALPVASIGSREILEETRFQSEKGYGTCVGRPLPGMDVAIIRITDEPIERWTDDLRLSDDEVGEIAVRGPVASASYHGRSEATLAAKIPADDGTFFHRMGDLGYRDHKGRLWFCGRKSHRVVTSDGTLFTVPCEAIFNRHPAVLRSALVGVGAQGRMRPVICVELEKRGDEGALRGEILALGKEHPHTRGIDTLLFHARFPVDIRHNAKIRREELADWAREMLAIDGE